LRKALATTPPGVAVCTIVEKHGSVPRGVGTRMLVLPDGEIHGTIGGGIGEHEIIQQARQAIADGGSRLLETSLAGEIELNSAAICGGRFLTLIGYWQGAADRTLAAAIDTALEAGRQPVLFELTAAGGGENWGRIFFDPETGTLLTAGDPPEPRRLVQEWTGSEATGYLKLAGCRVMATRLQPPPRMIIFGGGHLAVPLVEMAAWCGFAPTVIDDRPEFADPRRFPRASRVLAAPMDDVRELLAPGPTTYYVLITREHRHDDLLLRQLLGTSYAYLGMIGSRRRTAKVKERLVKDGYDAAEVAAVHAPIGLPIKAQTPEEIAISIMAEIIAVRNS